MNRGIFQVKIKQLFITIFLLRARFDYTTKGRYISAPAFCLMNEFYMIIKIIILYKTGFIYC